MKKINNAADLDRAIAELEHKAAFQKKDIQETFATVSENLKPDESAKERVPFRFTEPGTKKIFLTYYSDWVRAF